MRCRWRSCRHVTRIQRQHREQRDITRMDCSLCKLCMLSYESTQKRSLGRPRKRWISPICWAARDESPVRETEEELSVAEDPNVYGRLILKYILKGWGVTLLAIFIRVRACYCEHGNQLSGSIIGKNFVTSWETISFSGKIQLLGGGKIERLH
jgi:hypothetical protein